MTSVYVMDAATVNAVKTQERHKADGNGNCGFCLLHHGDCFKAGWCPPWQRAQAFINACKERQARIAARPSQRRPAPRTGSG